jgi:anthranilate synthase component 1
VTEARIVNGLNAGTIDPIAIAQACGPNSTGLFQTFDLHTRTLQRSIVATQMAVVDGLSFGDALDKALRRKKKGQYSSILVYASFETLVGSEVSDDDMPRFFVLGLRKSIEINHAAGTVTMTGPAAAFDELLRSASGHVSSNPPSSTKWQQDVDEAQHACQISEIKSAIQAGQVERAVLSIGLSKKTSADPFEIYRACVAHNPSPFGFVLDIGGFILVGSSPLRFARISHDRVIVETDAGTRPVTGDGCRH